MFKDELKLSKRAAMCLFTGIVTDSGRFKFSSVDGDTLRSAGILIDTGINIEEIYANLYLKDKKEIQFQGYLLKHIKFTKDNVAYLIITSKMRKKFNLILEEASAQISLLEGIKSSIIWAAFIENDQKTYRVRLRSRYVPINIVAEKHNGGGHERASGASAKDKNEIKAILAELDLVSREYKESHPTCL